eukprot:TRINITY_DN106314_c0_g1_i1.p2 TRINITY_DN106314_c0_g1~~TRINITY_DN106314_c0_g1_i1.p2  ORF type:complete len:112 (+),score=22.72 TRINITY_DN106314_c0_g1_i1:52-387(+)
MGMMYNEMRHGTGLRGSEQASSGVTLLEKASAPWESPMHQLPWTDAEARGIRHRDYSQDDLPLFPKQLVEEIRRTSSARFGAKKFHDQQSDSWWQGFGNMLSCCAQRDRED